MKNCKSMLYAISNHSDDSKWMPWELGYFDGINGRIGIVPITQNSEDNLTGSEYLSLYPIVKEYQIKGKEDDALWLYENEYSDKYVKLDAWVNLDTKPFKH